MCQVVLESTRKSKLLSITNEQLIKYDQELCIAPTLQIKSMSGVQYMSMIQVIILNYYIFSNYCQCQRA